MRDEQKAVNSVVVVMRTLPTRAVASENRPQRKMATIGDCVSGVAHEVNNPLAAIIGIHDLLLENPECAVGAGRFADYSAGNTADERHSFRICWLCRAAAGNSGNRCK